MISAYRTQAEAAGVAWGYYRFGVGTPVLWYRCKGQGYAARPEGLGALWITCACNTAVDATEVGWGYCRFGMGHISLRGVMLLGQKDFKHAG